MTNGVAAHQNTLSIAFLGSEGMAETISVSVQLPFLIANHKIVLLKCHAPTEETAVL